jgi:hypothetical protein
MPFIGSHPFDDYKIYGPYYHAKEKRRYVVLIHVGNKNLKTSMSYARYLVSVKENRILTEDEEVDHIDENKLNDSLDNLRILSSNENRLRSIKAKTLTQFICQTCGNEFLREKRRINSNTRFCSVACKNNGIGYNFKLT